MAIKKDIILNSTLELVSKFGVHNTPMSKVATHADVAVGTIYHHFNSKEEIFNALYLMIKKEFGVEVDQRLASDQTTREAFEAIFNGIYEYYTTNPLKFIFTEQVFYTPIITDKVKTKAQQYYQSIITYFEKNITDETFRYMAVELAVALFYGNIKTLIQLELSGDSTLVTDEMLNEAIRTSWISFKRE